MKILAIETSCDETAVSILECSGDATTPRFSVLGTGLYSQASKHAEYGGVYPNLAKREHQQNLVPMLTLSLKELNADIRNPEKAGDPEALKKILAREDALLEQLETYLKEHPGNPGIDAVAVTQGPGLEPALWVGLNFGKALSAAWGVPLIPVNHMEGHVVSVLTEHPDVSFPAVALLVSGGHTELQVVRTWGSYELLGETRDDAVGEAFDKVARLLGLPYPGGPEISRLAADARAGNVKAPFSLPRPMLLSDDYDFSYAGLKTAVLYKVKELGTLTDEQKKEIAREFEDAAVEVLVKKTEKALQETGAHTLIVGGGVIANTYLREELSAMLSRYSGTRLLLPTRELATDNAVMIGVAGYIAYVKKPDAFGVFSPEQTLPALGTMRL
ncbi:MAG: tRNA N6-adenosine threonylcarbamoyltransferase [Candidatus Campbellbacteria bacterium]